MPGRVLVTSPGGTAAISMPSEPNFIFTGLVTVAPFFGSTKNTRGFFAASRLRGRFCCLSTGQDAERRRQREREQRGLPFDDISRSPLVHSSRDGGVRLRPAEPPAAPCSLRRPVAGSSVSTRAATARANAGRPSRRRSRRGGAARRRAIPRASAAASVAATAGARHVPAAEPPDRAPARGPAGRALGRRRRGRRPGSSTSLAAGPLRASRSAWTRTSSGGGSMSSVNGIARFWTTVSCSSSTARSLTMPNRSTVASQSALSAIADVGASEDADRRRASGSVAPVTRLTNTSAVG